MRVAGALGRVRAGAPGGPPELRAELRLPEGPGGGPDRVTLIWLGRNRIAGIEPGRVLTVEGTLTRQRGQTIIYNPRYDLGHGP